MLQQQNQLRLHKLPSPANFLHFGDSRRVHRCISPLSQIASILPPSYSVDFSHEAIRGAGEVEELLAPGINYSGSSWKNRWWITTSSQTQHLLPISLSGLRKFQTTQAEKYIACSMHSRPDWLLLGYAGVEKRAFAILIYGKERQAFV